MSRVIKPGDIHHDHAPFDARELQRREDEQATPLEAAGQHASLARQITNKSQVVKLVKEEMADLIARVERMASERIERAEAESLRVAELVEASRAEGWEKGRQEGYQVGYEEGRKAGLESYGELLRSAQRILDETQALRVRCLEDAREDLVKLAVAVAHKLVPVSLDHSEAARALLQEMVGKAEGSGFARVRFPRAMVEALGDAQGALPAAPEGVRIEMVPDDALLPGDVVVETDWGILDGRLRARWERILRGLDLVGADDVATGSD